MGVLQGAATAGIKPAVLARWTATSAGNPFAVYETAHNTE